MNFIQSFVRRPVFTTMLFLSLIILGIISFSQLPFDLLPDITIPKLTILTEFEGASPEIIDEEITRRIEEATAGISGVQDISSISIEGKSIVTLYFRIGENLKDATLRLRERLDEIFWMLPDGTKRSVILTTGPTSTPIMGVWIKGEKELINGIFQKRLEQTKGVGEARIIGIKEKRMLIRIKPEILKISNINLQEIEYDLKKYNISVPLGNVMFGNYTLPIRFSKEIDTKEKIMDLPISGGRYKIKDIADVIEEEKEKDVGIFYNLKEGYLIEIYKEWKENSIDVSFNVRETLKKLKEIYPEIDYEIAYDDAVFLKASFKEVIIALILGSILAFLALFIFTNDFKTPFVLALAIPISIISSFFFIYIFGFKINLITLAGLSLSAGMLVDAGIVVLENIIFRKDPIKGASEVGIAVSTSILTNIAVFFPIVYIHGIAGSMLKPLSFAVISTSLISLFVSFTLIPLLSSKIKGITEQESIIFKNLLDGFSEFIEWIYLNKKYIYLFSTFLIIGGFLSFYFSKKEAFPNIKSDNEIRIELPLGVPLYETEKVVNELSMNLRRFGNILSKTGDFDPYGLSHSGTAVMRISTNKEIDYKRYFARYNINYTVKDINPIFSYFENAGKVKIRIFYNDFKEEEKISEVLKNDKNLTIPFFEKLDIIELKINPLLLEKLNINYIDFIEFIRANLKEKEILSVERGEERISLNITIGDKKRLDELLSLNIKGIKLSEIVDVRRKKVPMGIIRNNGKRCIEAETDFTNLKNLKIPFRYELSGEVAEYRNILKSAIFAFLIASFLVYLILASFYESFLIPFLIFLVVPFSLSGGLISLFITRTSINVISLIGLVLLTGICVNDAIVLIDYAKKLKIKNPGKEAAKRRLRPILMTTLTTIFGLLPLSFGRTLQAPLGRTVIGGLIISTFLSLVFIPIIYDKIFSK